MKKIITTSFGSVQEVEMTKEEELKDSQDTLIFERMKKKEKLEFYEKLNFNLSMLTNDELKEAYNIFLKTWWPNVGSTSFILERDTYFNYEFKKRNLLRK